MTNLQSALLAVGFSLSVLAIGLGCAALAVSVANPPVTIEKTCHFTWQNNPTKIPAEHYGRKNYNESVQMFGAPDKVECE